MSVILTWSQILTCFHVYILNNKSSCFHVFRNYTCPRDSLVYIHNNMVRDILSVDMFDIDILNRYI